MGLLVFLFKCSLITFQAPSGICAWLNENGRFRVLFEWLNWNKAASKCTDRLKNGMGNLFWLTEYRADYLRSSLLLCWKDNCFLDYSDIHMRMFSRSPAFDAAISHFGWWEGGMTKKEQLMSTVPVFCNRATVWRQRSNTRLSFSFVLKKKSFIWSIGVKHRSSSRPSSFPFDGHSLFARHWRKGEAKRPYCIKK